MTALQKLAVEAGFEYSELHKCLIVRHSNGSWVRIDENLMEFAKLIINSQKQTYEPAPYWMNPDFEMPKVGS